MFNMFTRAPLERMAIFAAERDAVYLASIIV